MTSMRRTTVLRTRLRSGALLLGATASIGLTACGGGDGGGGGATKADYQSALNAFCENLLTKQDTLDADVQKTFNGADPATSATAMARFLSEYASALTAELDTLGKTDAPSEYKTFDEDLSKGIAQMASLANTTADEIRKVDLSGVAKGDTSGLTELQKVLGGLSQQKNPLANLNTPADLAKAAPKCAKLLRDS